MNLKIPPTSCSSSAAESSAPGVDAYQPRLGLEMEMAVAHAVTGASLPVRAYFDALERIKLARGVTCERVAIGASPIGLRTPDADCGLDNGYNLLETALAPVRGGAGGLDRLAALAHQELADTLDALRDDGACVLNVSQHPDCPTDASWYERVRVARPIYRELVDYRGWHHWLGMDAKAQNGANTSVPVDHAALALNVMIGLAGAHIALFANSPLEAGCVTGLKETRLTLWSRVFGPANFPGDAILEQYPQRPFHDLGDYFRWMFQAGTVTRSLPLSQRYDYKSAPTVILDGDPCLLSFLQAARWRGRRTDTGEEVVLQPHAMHFEHSQIAQFLDARFRYRLDALPGLPALMRAWRRDGGLEELFASCGVDGYIEGRAPGAGFADACLLSEGGEAAARSRLTAPTALQAGLLANLGAAWQLIQDRGWQTLGELRQAAIRHGIAHDGVRALCADVLAVARAGLTVQERRWLDYPDYVLESGRTAADHLLDTWNTAGTAAGRLAALPPRHAALHPDDYRGLVPPAASGA